VKDNSIILYDEMKRNIKKMIYIIVMKKNEVEVKKKENIKVIS
jgi:hypothetical protein